MAHQRSPWSSRIAASLSSRYQPSEDAWGHDARTLAVFGGRPMNIGTRALAWVMPFASRALRTLAGESSRYSKSACSASVLCT